MVKPDTPLMELSNWRERRVAGIGLVNIDYVAVTNRWERDQKTAASHFLEQVGGPVPVALCAIARLDDDNTTQPLFFGTVGTENVSTFLVEALAAVRVDTR